MKYRDERNGTFGSGGAGISQYTDDAEGMHRAYLAASCRNLAAHSSGIYPDEEWPEFDA
jgi:hypothetical protein